MKKMPECVSVEDLGDGMKKAVYRLPKSDPGKVWIVVQGDIPEGVFYYLDPNDGGKWIQVEPYQTWVSTSMESKTMSEIKPDLIDGDAFCSHEKCPVFAPDFLDDPIPDGRCRDTGLEETVCLPYYRASVAELEQQLSEAQRSIKAVRKYTKSASSSFTSADRVDHLSYIRSLLPSPEKGVDDE